MGHGKETPRQKMIGMMYLVLTSLLALNVSAEILNAFILVDRSLATTAENFKKKNDAVYTAFQEKLLGNEAKVKPWKDKADEVKLRSQALIDTIQNYKELMVVKADGPETPYLETGDPREIKKKDENNIPSEVMILYEKGKDLKKMIENYRGHLMGLIEDTARYAGVATSIRNTLNTDDMEGQEGEIKSWEIANFHQLPLAGATTMLSKLQTDIRNAEADILGYLFGQIEAGSFKFNQIEAIVNAPTNYVLRGQTYKAEVFIAASDTTTEPKILVGGQQLTVKNGKGVYTGGTGTVGFKKWGGEIQLEHPETGEILKFPFSAEYQVGEPGLAISPTKMNVFYIGVDNPVDITVSGVPSTNVIANIGGGVLRKVGGNKYIVRVKRPGKATIRVSAKMDGGETRGMGSMEFRVKRLPSPVGKVKIGQKLSKGGLVKRNLLPLARVVADMGNFNFDLPVKVVGFTVSANIKGYNMEERSRSGRLTAKQIQLLKQLNAGQKVNFENIRAKLPDGTTRDLGSIVFKLN